MAKTPDVYYLGVDLGTGSCKVCVTGPQAEILGFSVGKYPASERYSRWEEQDPNSLLQGMQTAVRKAVQLSGVSGKRCGGLSLGGALHSLLPVDSEGLPLSGVMTWADGRAVGQADALRGSPQATSLYQQTGCPAHGMYPLYKIIWLRQNRPQVFKRARRFISAKDYVWHKLSAEYRSDYSLAAGSGLLDTHSLTWNQAALALAGITAEQLPSLGAPITQHPLVNRALAREMGLEGDVPLVLGSSDASNSNLGSGAIGSGVAALNVGTSGALRVICDQPVLDPQGRSWCYAIDREHWLVGGAINNGGLALDWLRESLNAAFLGDQELNFAKLLELARAVPPGAGGVLCLPFFAGERSPNWDLNARGAFFGLSLEHDARHLARATLEGIAFRIRSLADALEEARVGVKQVVASGGFTQSELWLEITATVLERRLHIPRWGESSSLGAAFWPLLAAGRFSSLEEVAGTVSYARITAPLQANIARYRRFYALYQQLYRANATHFAALASLRQMETNQRSAPARPAVNGE